MPDASSNHWLRCSHCDEIYLPSRDHECVESLRHRIESLTHDLQSANDRADKAEDLVAEMGRKLSEDGLTR